MSSVTGASSVPHSPPPIPRRIPQRIPQWTRGAYLAIACLSLAIVVWGFWRGYWRPLLAGGVDHFWFIHVHAAVFLSWMVLVVVQSGLVASRRFGSHRALGVAGAVGGLVVLALGLFISIAAPVARAESGQLQPAVAGLVALYNLTDMLIFGASFVLAIRYRASPAMHRRFIVFAGVALIGAAVGRVLPGESLAYAAVWLSPLLCCAAVDCAAEKRLHPVFLAAALVFAVMFFKVRLYAMVPASSGIGQFVVGPFL